MLSRLDDVIYPNRCEVIEIEPSQRYIYPIFKNASSSINEWATQQKYKILFNEQLSRIDVIDVILRNPEERFISGINSFIWNLKRDNPTFDQTTILYFVENYLFLNRHYAPQLAWLLNLFRYIDSTKINIVSMNSVKEYTPLNTKPEEDKILSDKDVARLIGNKFNEMYLRLDTRLLDLVGNKWTKIQIMTHLLNRDPQAYFDTIGKCNTILGQSDVLS